MQARKYELTDAVAGFDEGEILDVTARFGDWHSYRLKLEPASYTSSKTLVASGETGFRESAILDETARFGDWHEYSLAFDPTQSPETAAPLGRVEMSIDDFKRVAKPVETSG